MSISSSETVMNDVQSHLEKMCAHTAPWKKTATGWESETCPLAISGDWIIDKATKGKVITAQGISRDGKRTSKGTYGTIWRAEHFAGVR